MSIHAHSRFRVSSAKEVLRLALFLTASIMVIEFIAGCITGSLSLVADAAHMLTDVSALALSLFAAYLASRVASAEKTYGYYRTEILSALANGVALWVIVVWIYVRALKRLHAPTHVDAGPMIAVASIGLCVNILCGFLLNKERSHNLNVQGAWLNVMSDALGSIGVIIAGFLIRWYGWTIADPIAGMAIGVLIALSSWGLLKQSVNILLEAAPSHLALGEVIQAIQHLPGVKDVHDVHIWTITTGMHTMSGHVVVSDINRCAEVLSSLSAMLEGRFGISHTTFQLEPEPHHSGR